MVQKIRRFVTGHNAAGKAIVMIDDHAPNATEIKGWPGLGVTEVWVTDEMPVDNHGARDRSLRPMRHDPTPSGTIFRVVEIPPESSSSKIDPAAAFGHLGSTNKPKAEDLRQAPDYAQNRLHRLSRRYFRFDAHAHGRRRSRVTCGRLHRATRHQSRLGQQEWQALSARGGADRRQAGAVIRRRRRCAHEPGWLGRKMGARRA